MRYSFVLGNREGVYRVASESATVTPVEKGLKPIEFELQDGCVIRPTGFEDDEFDDSQLALPFLTDALFPDPSTKHKISL